MSGSITFSGGDGGTLLFTPSNGPSNVNTYTDFLDDAFLATQISYGAALGNTANMEIVEVNEKGAPDTINLQDDLIAIAPGVQGAEYVVNAGASNDTVNGSSFGDTINGEGGNDTIFGNGGDDEIYGGNGRDTIKGNTGNDTIYGGNGGDNLRGGQGKDSIYGDDGNDQLFGDKGNDRLDGGAGNDRYTGGTGRDVFVFSNSDSDDPDFDRILDFGRGRDQIDLTGVANLAAIDVTVLGGRRVELDLSDASGDTIQAINVLAQNTYARNVLLQEGSYGDNDGAFGDRVIVDSGVSVTFPGEPTIIL